MVTHLYLKLVLKSFTQNLILPQIFSLYPALIFPKIKIKFLDPSPQPFTNSATPIIFPQNQIAPPSIFYLFFSDLTIIIIFTPTNFLNLLR